MNPNDILRRAVIAELEWEPRVVAADIGVTADGGVVTLTGYVSSYPEKHAAEQAVMRVKGVKAVAEALKVRLPSEAHRTDEDIAAAAVQRLDWNISLPVKRIHVRVEAGWITLTGQVDHHFQKEAAADDVRHLTGVRGVSNLIEVTTLIDTANISDDIAHALHRSWFFDPDTIKVRADGGKVTLTGTVRTPHDRRAAAATAWTEPGVTEVENDLIVA
ncbi:MAG: BON domain-containing protein [Caulobacteraceae bacterium]|jgi:osmotically-inducible protein OsmY